MRQARVPSRHDGPCGRTLSTLSITAIAHEPYVRATGTVVAGDLPGPSPDDGAQLRAHGVA